MSGLSCPEERAILAAYRRGVDVSLSAHLDGCAACGRAIAAERALTLLAVEADVRPYPSAAVIRLESELRAEERRLARRARFLIGLHAGALALTLALFAAVRFVEPRLDPSAPKIDGAGSICAIVAVLISLWNLVRAADELAVTS